MVAQTILHITVVAVAVEQVLLAQHPLPHLLAALAVQVLHQLFLVHR
jgi:hypothetical protein